MNDYTKGMLKGLLEAVRWSFALIVGGVMLSYLLLVIDTYFIHPELLTMLYSDSIRLMGISGDVTFLKKRFISTYFFLPFIQGSVVCAAIGKAFQLLFSNRNRPRLYTLV